MDKIDAKFIMKLLEEKHYLDIFVPECKNGRTTDAARGENVRMDGWAMKRSWTNPLAIGYEVKVSRGDFLQDKKMLRYHDYCNQLYLVCPHGMIKKEEVDPSMGLMYVNKDKKSLYTMRKAPMTPRDIPSNVYRYILMSRSIIKTGLTLEQKAERGRIIDSSFKHNSYYGIKKAMKDHGMSISQTIERRLSALEGNDGGLNGFLHDIRGGR